MYALDLYNIIYQLYFYKSGVQKDWLSADYGKLNKF